MKIVILAFNIGISKNGFVNGPGMSLYNFAKFISKYLPKIKLSIYTHIESSSEIPGVEIKTTRYATDLLNDIKSCKAFHCWSGLINTFLTIIRLANTYRKPVILGPNLLDIVDFKKEKYFLKNIEYKRILTVNDRLKYLISNKHVLLTDEIESFIVGPDLDLWSPPDKYGKYILWKGNSSHMVKDIGFAKEIKDRLSQYEFMFMGDGKKYKYNDHIDDAKKAYLYISTSLSETKGMALMEQWAAGVPSVTHPKIYQHGENYKTGIITNKDIDSYCEAITEIMENSKFRADLSKGARDYMLNKFDPKLIADQYFRILNNVS
jgi:glycosyltransferase involved in cell wall biosynthesis